jgi:hypothetical protein
MTNIPNYTNKFIKLYQIQEKYQYKNIIFVKGFKKKMN